MEKNAEDLQNQLHTQTANGLWDSMRATGYLPTAPPCPRHPGESLQELGLAQGLQDQLEEAEAAVISPVCSGEKFWDLEKGAGCASLTAGRVRPRGKEAGVVLWRATCLQDVPLL